MSDTRAYEKDRWAKVVADPALREKKRAHDAASRKRRFAKLAAYDKARDPLKLSARNIVRQRIKRGTLQRGVCEVCGDPKTQAHHDDYSKPLAVRWLCSTHHKEAHAHE